MVAVEGGTQALRRTVNARLVIESGNQTTISVPTPFAAVILKAAAYQTYSLDPDRHLYDAAALLCCIDDPVEVRNGFAGSDRGRIQLLRKVLPDEHPAWRDLSLEARTQGQAALLLLSAD